MSTDSTPCPHCGAPVKAGLLGGLCQACVRRVALGGGMTSLEADPDLTVVTPPNRASRGSKPTHRWEPPSLDEMRSLLPMYDFVGLIGRGGMGAVYQATQISLERLVAVKVLPADLMEDVEANFADRFKNEARTLARMKHPGIVQVHDFGEAAGRLLYFVMEFIDGTDVARMIQAEGRLAPEKALPIIIQVCDALAYAHSQGVVHRDIKPANILIDAGGRVKVADFGLAKVEDPSLSGLTRTNMAVGTPDFVAPEALMPGVQMDGRADVYAVGVTLFQMLTGDMPRLVWEMPSQRHSVDPRLDGIIARAMQPDRDLRYASVEALKEDVETVMSSKPELASPPRNRRRTWMTAAAAVVVLFLVVSALLPRPERAQISGGDGRGAAAEWRDWVQTSRSTGAFSGDLARFFADEGSHMRVTSLVFTSLLMPDPADGSMANAAFANGEVRATWSLPKDKNAALRLRLSYDRDKAQRQWYEALFEGGETIRLFFVDGMKGQGPDARELLAAARMPFRVDRTFMHTVIFQAQGTRLCLKVNGDELVSANDERLKEGLVTMLLPEGTKLESLSVRTLQPHDSPVPVANPTRGSHEHAGHRYRFLPAKVNWQDAAGIAKEQGGHLVDITSEEEFLWLAQTFGPQLRKQGEWMWTGGHSPGKGQPFKWTNGAPLSFTNWLFQGKPEYRTENQASASFAIALRSGHRPGEYGWSDVETRILTPCGFIIEWGDDAKPSINSDPGPTLSAAKGAPVETAIPRVPKVEAKTASVTASQPPMPVHPTPTPAATPGDSIDWLAVMRSTSASRQKLQRHFADHGSFIRPVAAALHVLGPPETTGGPVASFQITNAVLKTGAILGTQGHAILQLRHQTDATSAHMHYYELSVLGNGMLTLSYVDSGGSGPTGREVLAAGSYTHDLDLKLVHEIEFSALESVLEARVDGHRVLRAYDDRLAGGRVYFQFSPQSSIVSLALRHLHAGADAAQQSPPIDWRAPKQHGGHRYRFIPGRIQWEHAEIVAQSLGGHLIDLTTREECDWAAKAFKLVIQQPGAWFWTGGRCARKDAPFLWSNREEVRPDMWLPDHPARAPNYPGDTSFAIVFRQLGERHGWNDMDVRTVFSEGFVVEWDTP